MNLHTILTKLNQTLKWLTQAHGTFIKKIIRTMKTHLFMIITLVLLTGSLSAQDNKASVSLAAAIYEEEVSGNLDKAVELYLNILKKYPDDRLVAAKTLYHLGLVNEKMGKQKAIEYFTRLVNTYPDQTEIVALAKERLAGLVKTTASAPQKPIFRKIRTPFSIPNWSGSQLSPDGKTLAFGSGNTIWTVPIPGRADLNLAGEPKELSGAADVLGDGLSWSGDGRWIAFSRAYSNDVRIGGTSINFRPEGAYIDVIPSSGGEPKRIPVPQWVVTKGDTQRQLSLSPDGKIVAFDSGGQIYVASVGTGEIRQVTKDGGISPCFSPDGTNIAYLTPQIWQDNPPSRLSEVRVISTEGGDPVKISGDLRENLSRKGPTWSPDGKMIAFGRINLRPSLRAEICIVTLSEKGKPVASPVQIELPLFSTDFLTGWTPDNKIGLLLETPYHEYVYTVPVSGGKASQVSPLESLASHPRWSPDGKRIFFRWKKGGLGSVPSDGGEVSVHPNPEGALKNGFFTIYPGAGNSISPDGKFVVVSAGTATAGPNIYTIPVEGGEPKQITSGGSPAYPCWSPDGKWIAYLDQEFISDEKPITIIFKIPAAGGDAQKITTESDNVTEAGLDWSPDGKTIAYFSKKADTSAGTLNLVQIAGGESREVCRVQNIIAHNDVSWSPDGQQIVFVSMGKIWVVPAEGGEPVEVKTDVDANAGTLDWSPDGRKIAFSGDSGMDIEFWFMENFLPK
jgi:Tol biopolymer transport system component